MTQITDEMVEAAVLSIGGWVKAGESFNDHMRAALEAALAVLRPATVDLAARLRWRNSYGSVQVDEDLVLHAADLIERQAEEIVLHKEVICMLTADRAEMIAALRPFARAVYNDNGDVTISHASIGEYMRARACLKRLGANGVA